jgi:hypothetical protein
VAKGQRESAAACAAASGCGNLRQLCCTAAEIKNKTVRIGGHDDVRASDF